MPDVNTIRQVTDADWFDVIRCWYAEEPLDFSVEDTIEKLKTSNPYTCWGLWKNSTLVAATWISAIQPGCAHVLPIRCNLGIQKFDRQKFIQELWLQVASYYQENYPVSYFQALVPEYQVKDRQALEIAGFQYLTPIIQMQLSVRQTKPQLWSHEMSIHRVTEKDWQPFIHIFKRCSDHSLDVPELNVFKEEGCIQPQYDRPEISAWLLVIKSELVGIMAFERSTLSDKNPVVLQYLGILPEHRQKGYGRQALQMLCNMLFSNNASNGEPFADHFQTDASACQPLELRVDARNYPARKLYEQAGFKVIQNEMIYIFPPLQNRPLKPAHANAANSISEK